MNEVVREWPVNAAGARAFLLARQRGQVVAAERRGDVVRVVLRSVEVPRARRTPTGPRQDPDRSSAGAVQKPRRSSTNRVVVVGISVGVGLSIGAGVVWGFRELIVWAGHHVAQLIGGGVVLLLIAALLTWATVGGDSHPCDR